MTWRCTSLGTLAGVVAGLLGGCAPNIDTGCDQHGDCDRGQLYELMTGECVDQSLSTDATESPTPTNFSSATVPFFRGTVCTVHEVQAGASFPVRMDPCLHPCLDVSQFEFKHNWNCLGSSCEAYGMMWVTAAGNNCPEDAFGRFDRSQCVYPRAVEFTINATHEGGNAVEGQMRLEVPFMTNADAARIAADKDNTELREEIVQKYPEDEGRVPGGMNISLLSGNPAPPETCGDTGEMCECFEIGF